MKVNDPNLNSPGITTGSTTANRAEHASRLGTNQRTGSTSGAGVSSSDDVHLSELVRSLRSLAADSPERQAKIERLARAYADGSYKPDAEATAAAMIEDAFND